MQQIAADPACKVMRYITLKEQEAILEAIEEPIDNDEVDFWESVCTCADCLEFPIAPALAEATA